MIRRPPVSSPFPYPTLFRSPLHPPAGPLVRRAVRGDVRTRRPAVGQRAAAVGHQHRIDGVQLVDEPVRRLYRRGSGTGPPARPAGAARPRRGRGPRTRRPGRDPRHATGRVGVVGPVTSAAPQRPGQRTGHHDARRPGDDRPFPYSVPHCPPLPTLVLVSPLSTGAGSLARQLSVPPIRSAETSVPPALPASNAVRSIVESSRLSSPVVPLTSTRPATAVCTRMTSFAPVAENGPPTEASVA